MSRRFAVLALSLAAAAALGGTASASPSNGSEDRGICLILDNPSTPGPDRICVFSS